MSCSGVSNQQPNSDTCWGCGRFVQSVKLNKNNVLYSYHGYRRGSIIQFIWWGRTSKFIPTDCPGRTTINTMLYRQKRYTQLQF
jgi:hypothetical protein